ncbi:MAG: hypothetical protein PHZ19_02270 [Candidatus Thermoplasmatota archaeon]|nr:hypothetical protein [Candidatus Thermoplasmatota archaeon]
MSCRTCTSNTDLPTRLEADQEKIRFYNTDTFATISGMEMPVYSNMKDIPSTLPDGLNIVLTEDGYPRGDTTFDHARLYVDYIQEQRANGLVAWVPVVFFVIKVAVLATAVILVVREFRRAISAPCGETGYERQIDECTKLIVYPDCSGMVYNTCTGEVEDRFKSRNIIDILKYAVIGAVVIGAVVIAVKTISPRKEKQ